MKSLLALCTLALAISPLCAQKVGINTDNPHSVLHVHSAGLAHHPDGLLLLGSRSEAHLMADFNYLQSFWSDQGTVLNMYLQPHGGNVGINVPFNYASFAPLHVFGDGVNTTTYGIGLFGNRLLKHLVVDHDRIQARNNNDEGTLYLQAAGGDIDMAGGTVVVDRSLGTVGIGDANPDAALDIISNGNTSSTRALQIRSSSFGNLFNVRDDGHVGIGTSAPNYDLEVIGSIGVTSKLVHSNDNDTYLQFLTDKMTFSVGGEEVIEITEYANGQDNIAIGGTDVDINLNGSALHVSGANGWVGIGTTSPDAKFEVNGDMKVSHKIIHTLDDDTYLQFTTDRFRLYTGNRPMLDIFEGESDYLDIANGTMYVNHTTGTVGIGVYGADSELHIIQTDAWDGGITLENEYQDDWRISNDPNGYLKLYKNGNWRGTFNPTSGDYSSASDRRLKKNMTDLGPVLERITQLDPKMYHFKTQDDGESKHIGLIAQEVNEIFPEAVHYNAQEDLYGVDYGDFGVISIQAIKELTEIVRLQQAQIDALKEEVHALQSQAGGDR
ncbi:MAG: tail fiber domain-containing protein [Saprospiraceae bacterium]|nr:tail fiber domain-containing protein [Saprospiraceae bacterium]